MLNNIILSYITLTKMMYPVNFHHVNETMQKYRFPWKGRRSSNSSSSSSSLSSKSSSSSLSSSSSSHSKERNIKVSDQFKDWDLNTLPHIYICSHCNEAVKFRFTSSTILPTHIQHCEKCREITLLKPFIN